MQSIATDLETELTDPRVGNHIFSREEVANIILRSDATIFRDFKVEMMVESIVIALVDNRPAVVIKAVTVGTLTELRLRVAPEDVGKVIGKGGRHARALRTLLAAASVAAGHRYSLNIARPGTPSQEFGKEAIEVQP